MANRSRKAKLYRGAAIVALALVVVTGGMVNAQGNSALVTKTADRNVDGKTAILDVLSAYESALNNSDAAAAMNVYAEDGVVMAPNNHSVVGKAALRTLYEAGSKAFLSKSNSLWRRSSSWLPTGPSHVLTLREL